MLLGGLVLGLALGAVVLLMPNRTPAETARVLPPTVGSPVADFSLDTLDGRRVSLAGWKGRPVLINFWATWCPPCREEMPLLEQVAKRYPNLVVAGVNAGESQDLVAPFVDEFGITFPILLDSAEDVTNRYFVHSFPATFFVDADGVLRAQHIGLLTEDVLSRYLIAIGVE
jgi:thiol-disulfide isomerase/thioredoxin